MSEKLAVNFVSPPYGGVRTACNYVETIGFDIVRPRRIIEDFARDNAAFLNSRADYLRTTKKLLEANPDAFVEPVLNSKSRLVAIEGLQIPIDIRRLKSWPGLREEDVAVISPEHTRYERAMVLLGAAGKPLISYEAFMKDEYVDYFNISSESEETTEMDESSTNMLHIMHEAKYKIVNQGIGKLEFGKRIYSVLSKIAPEDFPPTP